MFIIGIAGLYTFYEVDRHVRNPKVSAKLKGFYSAGERFVHMKVTNDEEFDAYKTAVTHWFKGAETWIQDNMSHAAGSLLRDRRNIMPMSHAHDYNREHMGYINTIQKWRGNLEKLINSDEWDTDGERKILKP